MARAKQPKDTSVEDYRYDETRKNIPPAGLAAQGRIRETAKAQYAYNPHLPPTLRFDSTGAADKLHDLVDKARTQRLSDDEAQLLQDALRNHEPWLEWAGKREQKSFEVDPVALHMHERVSARAILSVAAREDVQRDLFADPQQEYADAVRFCEHDVDWANRLILGDSLQVMASLAHREGLAGKVQMIYMDPPYGINFRSNFQPEVGRRDVADRQADLTREPEMVKAFRDTWTLGVHSYLAYLRDRFVMCRELLTDSGSMFVQIGIENAHRVRAVLDEVFGVHNFVSQITFAKTSSKGSNALDSVYDILLFYAKNRPVLKYRQLFRDRPDELTERDYTHCELPSGLICKQPPAGTGVRRFMSDNPSSQGETIGSSQEFVFEGRSYFPARGRHWRVTVHEGMPRLAAAGRLFVPGKSLRAKAYSDDYGLVALNNIWRDTLPSSFGRGALCGRDSREGSRAVHMHDDGSGRSCC